MSNPVITMSLSFAERFVSGRKYQLVVDRMPEKDWNMDTDPEILSHIMGMLTADVVVFEELVTQTLDASKTKKTNGADEVNEVPEGFEDKCSALVCDPDDLPERTGKAVQFLLDTDQKRYTVTSLSLFSVEELLEEEQAVRNHLLEYRSKSYKQAHKGHRVRKPRKVDSPARASNSPQRPYPTLAEFLAPVC